LAGTTARMGAVVPVEAFGQAFKGHNGARKVAAPFRYMEADLYNLQPAIGEVNRLWLNYSMALIPGEARAFGRCDLEIEDRKIEPRPDIRGDIARTSFYMDAAYPGCGIVSENNQKLCEA